MNYKARLAASLLMPLGYFPGLAGSLQAQTAGNSASAADTKEVAPAQADIWTQTYLTGNWGGVRDDLKNVGVSITPTYYGEVFGNPSGGMRQGVVTDGLLNTALDLDFDPLTSGAVKDLTFHTEAEYIYGNSLSQ